MPEQAPKPFSYSDLEIEENVPIPDQRSRTQGLASLFKRMKKGQSVFIPYNGKKPQSASSGCHSAARNAGVQILIRKASKEETTGTGRNKKTETVQGLRVWRLDEVNATQEAKKSGARIR